ncbi:DUF5597 domain-containing protein [Pelagicoccus sp. SDUM812003]|uniref:GH35 family beta-galactosidase n=1 Tax=Pelagicoccus sp. SDUM812003 TaxID=3041267 RepID=UPI00280F40EA|nr:DUF5597 domain-containing protein [Pelagicoccus sp. SDUM812003]MDQ8201432.1 DUF5597 domain-containing protein [Pelagicoccus sp. SDUM812003]
MQSPSNFPHLRKQGTATQLIVKGQPYLVLGGELHNSSTSSAEFLAPLWPKLRQLNLNTVLAAVSWELLEPEEGHFDFSLVDSLISSARAHDLKLILLWFGTWKNGLSNYVPTWVKRDSDRFARAKTTGDIPLEIVSTFSINAREADAKAFAGLMQHLRECDGEKNTVIMAQVENEVGILGDSRDRSSTAMDAYSSDVPPKLIQYLLDGTADKNGDLSRLWRENGSKTEGNWSTVFGEGTATDELFMAWQYASYIEHVAAAGRAEYPLPLFANAWLSSLDSGPGGVASGGQRPGEWPSGGPLPHTMDVWQIAAPTLDLLAPDIYQPQFTEWCRRYARRENPLFIPEMHWNDLAATQLFYPIGEHDCVGVSPFAIDSIEPGESNRIQKSFHLLKQLAPTILGLQGFGKSVGFILNQETPNVRRELGGYELRIMLDEAFGQDAKQAGGLILQIDNDTFIGAGFGFQVAFSLSGETKIRAGIESIEEGRFKDGEWTPGRRLNGDEAGRGVHWRFLDFESPDGALLANKQATGISICRLYRYW